MMVTKVVGLLRQIQSDPGQFRILWVVSFCDVFLFMKMKDAIDKAAAKLPPQAQHGSDKPKIASLPIRRIEHGESLSKTDSLIL
jgi:hypothetical protein